jgi:hypothetical protein
VEFEELALGEYQFQAQCRDFAGILGDTLEYLLSIVEPDLNTTNILIVDETKDGNGRPGSPDDPQCDDFYRMALDMTPMDIDPDTGDTLTWQTPDGWVVNEIDYATHQVGGESYISPLDLYNKHLIVWHADDRSQLFLNDNIGVLGQYLDAGGRLILSGHNVLGAFTEEDEATFTSGGFANTYLRLAGGKKNGGNQFIGMSGNADIGCPSVTIDANKIPPSWDGVGHCWTFEMEHRTIDAGYWRGEPSDTEFEGGVCCLMNFSPVNPWRTITLGFPLYFTVDSEGREFMQWALTQIRD